jgi:parvulin-like peptidyl-prolyl isomerase
MAQKLEFLTSDVSRMEQPLEAELEQYFAENQASYRGLDTTSFIHVFVDPEKRGEASPGDAAEILAQLQVAGLPGADTIQQGDRLLLPNSFTLATELDVSRQLGSRFARAVMKLEAGRWHGPLLSGFGLHLVYVYDSVKAPPAKFEDLRQQVLKDWHEQRREQFNANFLESLKSQYEIVIDELPADRLLDAQMKTSGENAIEVEAVKTDSAS